MGELDKFSGKGVVPSISKSLTTSGTQTPAWAQGAKRQDTNSADGILHGASGRFAIALDATGSMAGLIEMAKRSVQEILTRVMRQAGRPVEIMLVAYRDYDVPNEIAVASAPSKDHNALISWLGTIQARGGGSNDGEAIERALEAIGEAGRFDAIVVAGDESPNSRAFLRTVNRGDAPLAEDMARRFSQANTPVHTFVVGDDPRTIRAFAQLASLSGGQIRQARWKCGDDRYGCHGHACGAEGSRSRKILHAGLPRDFEGRRLREVAARRAEKMKLDTPTKIWAGAAMAAAAAIVVCAVLRAAGAVGDFMQVPVFIVAMMLLVLIAVRLAQTRPRLTGTLIKR